MLFMYQVTSGNLLCHSEIFQKTKEKKSRNILFQLRNYHLTFRGVVVSWGGGLLFFKLSVVKFFKNKIDLKNTLKFSAKKKLKRNCHVKKKGICFLPCVKKNLTPGK